MIVIKEYGMIFLYIGASLFLLGNIFYLWSSFKKNYGLVDIAWGLSFLFTAIICFQFSIKNNFHIVLLAIIALWSLRLSLYLSIRNIGHSEDFRYQQMRKAWGAKSDINAYFKIFLFQPLLSFIISLPFIMAFQKDSLPSIIELAVGFFIFLTGLIFESWADYSLFKFKKNPANQGKILTTGAWKYSRHPNYFGECALWWGIFIATGEFFIHPWTIVSPLLISFLLMKVSGVPLLEKHYEHRSDYSEYAKKTNTFFPWFPKN